MQPTKLRENSPIDDKIQVFVNDLAGKSKPPHLPSPLLTIHPSPSQKLPPAHHCPPATTLTVLPTTRVSSLKTLLSSKLAIAESELRLVFAGKLLASPSSTLQSYGIQNDSTVHLALALKGGVSNPADAVAGTSAPSVPLSDLSAASSSAGGIPALKPVGAGSGGGSGSGTSTPSKPGKKPRCSLPVCNAFAQKIVGDCQFCGGHFCGKHRMLEDHDCAGLADCKKESHALNKAKLESERTSAVRMM